MLKEDLHPFKIWLAHSGAEILLPTNPYELLRMKWKGKTGLIYKNKKDQISFVCPVAQAAFDLFKKS